MKHFYIFFFFFLSPAFSSRSFLKIDENFKALTPPHLLNLDSMKNDSIIIISKNKLNNSDFKELNMKEDDNSSYSILETDTKKSEILNQNFHIFGLSANNKKANETLTNETIIKNRTNQIDCDKNKIYINVHENFLSNNFSILQGNFLKNETFKKIDELVGKEKIPSNLKNLTINLTYIILDNRNFDEFEKILGNHNLEFNEFKRDSLSNFSQLLIFHSPKKEIKEKDKKNSSMELKNNSKEFRETNSSLNSVIKNTNDFLTNAKREINLNATLKEKAKETINKLLNATKLESKKLILNETVKKEYLKPQINQLSKSFEGASNLKYESVSFNLSSLKAKNSPIKTLPDESLFKKSSSNANLFKPRENDWEGILDSEGIPDDGENDMLSILNQNNHQNKSIEKSQKNSNISNFSKIERFSTDKKSDIDFEFDLNDNQTGMMNQKELHTKFDSNHNDDLKSKINTNIFESKEIFTKDHISNTENSLTSFLNNENLTLKENNGSNISFTQQNITAKANVKNETSQINYSEVPIYTQSTNNSIKFSEKTTFSQNLDSQIQKKPNEKVSKKFEEKVSTFEDPIIVKNKLNTNTSPEISLDQKTSASRNTQKNIIAYDNKKKKEKEDKNQNQSQEHPFDYFQDSFAEKLEKESNSPIFRERSENNEFLEGLTDDLYINDKKNLDLKKINEPAFQNDALYEMNGMENNEFLNPHNNMMANFYDDDQGY